MLDARKVEEKLIELFEDLVGAGHLPEIEDIKELSDAYVTRDNGVVLCLENGQEIILTIQVRS